MISELFLSAMLFILVPVISLLPEGDLPSAIATSFDYVGSTFAKASAFFPMSVIFTIIGLTIAIESSILTFKVGNWIYDKIRGAG